GEPSIGFHATVTSSQAIFPPEFRRKEYFDVEYAETYIAKTRMAGLFTAGNGNCILVPENVSGHEIEKLEDSPVEFHVLDSRENALGNLVLANDNGAVISEKLEDRKEEIEDALEVPVEVGEVAGLPSPGACGAATNQGVLLHRAASEEEAEHVKEVLDVEEVDIGTVNLGSPYIGSGLAGHEKKLLVGEDTSGPEVGRIDRTLHLSGEDSS
ncbi:MAG: translation initiation factor IF-6, partial [Candidatus Nanohaloarchaea archaeon]